MILPPHIAKNITHFQIDYRYGHDKDYNSTCDDVYIVYFSRELSFLWMKYRKEWQKTYKFSRVKNSDGWVKTPGSEEFFAQLDEIQNNTWCKVPPEIYELIKVTYPEYFL